MNLWFFVVVATWRVYRVQRFDVMTTRRVSLGRFQQMIAVTMGKNAVLSIDEETTSSSQWSSAHLEKLNGRIRCENEIFVGSNEHKNDGESATDNHPISNKWNGGWGEDSAQVDPSTDRGCKFTDALGE